RRAAFTLLLALLVLPRVSAQVTYDRLLRAADDARNWLTYNGNYSSNRYSQLRQITSDNVKYLEQKWTFQGNVMGNWEATPLVVDGVMYITQRPNDILALDAKSGRAFWMFRYNTPTDQKACCGSNNRGVGVLGERVFMGTLDAHLVAVDRNSGRLLWDT